MNPLAQALVQRGGYNETDARNASTGPRAVELAREFGVSSGATTPQSSGAQNYGAGPIGLASQAMQLQQQYAQPAVNAINQGLSETKNAYSSLLDSVKKRTETQVASEFGKRGIPISSGIVGQAQNEQVSQNQAGVLAQQANSTTPFYQMLTGLAGGGNISDFLNYDLGLKQLAQNDALDSQLGGIDFESELGFGGGGQETSPSGGGAAAQSPEARAAYWKSKGYQVGNDGYPAVYGVSQAEWDQRMASDQGGQSFNPQSSYTAGQNPGASSGQLANLRSQPTANVGANLGGNQSIEGLLSLLRLGNISNPAYNISNVISRYLP